MSREYTYHTYLPDGDTVDISDESAGYDRFIECYCQYGDLKVEIRPFQFGKSIDDQPTLRTTKLSKLIGEEDLEQIEYLKEMGKDLNETDTYVLGKLYPHWVPPTTYKELENGKVKQSELKRSIAKLRRLHLVEYDPGRGYSLTREGELVDLSVLGAAQSTHNN